MTVHEHPFDSGLQPERALLAWRRTTLSMAVGTAIAVRLSMPVIGPTSVLIGLLCLCFAAAAYSASWRRYRRIHRALVSDVPANAPAGGAIAFMALAALLLAGGALAFVIATGFARMIG